MTEPEDDDRLRPLRAVWLSLPDEDPPDRGLAQLMAAARAQADVMARPSRWRRWVQQLRRPPVLALATVTVVIAGAVLVGRNHAASPAWPPATPKMPGATEDDRKPMLDHATPAATRRPSDDGAEAGQGVQPEGLARLIERCHASASAGDCPAARELAHKIKKQDAAAYRARVVKDAAVAKCLSE